MSEKNYKESLNLPKTNFSMKANLSQREPEYIKKWEENKLYHTILAKRQGQPNFVLHDGPPYANGNIHLGHALNKILKDIIVKSKNMSNFYSPYIPGWDCHGLPIEHQVMKNLGPKAKTLSLDNIRKQCREYAAHYIEVQKKDFKRLGVLGDFENPYLTMSLDYEADILEALGELLAKNHVYKGLKPVYWCGHCNTALADAEVEYYDHESPSIYVEFPVTKHNFGVSGNVSILIWTTTPWTLPANVAISFHPDFQYSLIQTEGRYLVIAKELVSKVAEKTKISYREEKILTKKDLESIEIAHPFIKERKVVPVFGTHVTLEAGTGAVHTAPGHGTDDYEMGLLYGLPILSPVDHNACFTEEVKEWAKMHVFEANPLIINKLKEDKKLLFEEKITHSYFHCWRCKKPVIYRATPQWFISVSDEETRKKLLEIAEKQVKWIPESGKTRIKSMLENRPDWCISRQRSWGVPIPAVSCKKCGTTHLTPAMIQQVAEKVRKEGLDAWFTQPIDYFLKDFACSKCGSKEVEKENDILDVWFDSGVSWFAVIKRRNLPEDQVLYLEGSDQHRGWFQSSLIPSVLIQNKAPYTQVLTHGFMLDEQGRAMSKSLGNGIDPQDIIKEFGADILRLWVTTQDYREDMRMGKNLLNQTADAYRKIRNTFRFLLGNLYDFDPEKDRIDFQKLNPLDKWALFQLKKVIQETLNAYENYEFNKIYRLLYHFTNIELSAFYFDILKDMLYTSKKNGHNRRSSQTVMFEITDSLVRLLAPVLSFTAEDIWENFMPGKESIHLQLFPNPQKYPDFVEIEKDFEILKEVREDCLKALEIARTNKVIGASLEAKLVIQPLKKEIQDILEKYASYLGVLFIVSEVEIVSSLPGEVTHTGQTAKISVKHADGTKCPRCWKYRKNFQEICHECQEAL